MRVFKCEKKSLSPGFGAMQRKTPESFDWLVDLSKERFAVHYTDPHYGRSRKSLRYYLNKSALAKTVVQGKGSEVIPYPSRPAVPQGAASFDSASLVKALSAVKAKARRDNTYAGSNPVIKIQNGKLVIAKTATYHIEICATGTLPLLEFGVAPSKRPYDHKGAASLEKIFEMMKTHDGAVNVWYDETNSLLFAFDGCIMTIKDVGPTNTMPIIPPNRESETKHGTTKSGGAWSVTLVKD